MRVLKGHEDTVRCLSYSPDGQLLAAGDEMNYVLLWALPAGEKVGELDRDNGSVEAVAFHPSGKLLAAGLPDDIDLWDVEQRKLVVEKPAHAGGTRALAWSPDGKTLASGGWDSAVRLWPANLENSATLPASEPVMALAYLPDGQRLAVCGNRGLLRLLYPGTPGQQAERKHGRGLFSLAVSPDGALIATGDDRGDILLWKLPSVEPAATLQGHEWTVYGLAFTPDGQRLVSGSADGTVRLWEVGTRRLVETYRWHSRWVTSVAVSPDGMTAAAGSADATIVVWDLADA